MRRRVHGVIGQGISGKGGHYRRPALVELPAQAGPMLRETFAPILYVVRHRELDQAIAAQNAVAQGLSSSISFLPPRSGPATAPRVRAAATIS